MSQFRIFSHQQLPSGRRRLRAPVLLLLGLAWVSGSFLSQAQDVEPASGSMLDRTTNADGFDAMRRAPASANRLMLPCPQFDQLDLRMDCHLTVIARR